MTAGSPTLRGAALLSVGAIGVHELRYMIAFGGDAESALDHHGHAYLSYVTPLIGLALTWLLARLLVRAATGAPADSERAVRVRRLWPTATAALIGIYTVQELAEGVLAPGHPGGWEGVVGNGGWVAIPLAVAIGGLAAIGMRVLRRQLAELPPPLRAPRALTVALPALIAPVTAILAPRARLLARNLAGRAPPSFVV